MAWQRLLKEEQDGKIGLEALSQGYLLSCVFVNSCKQKKTKSYTVNKLKEEKNALTQKKNKIK